MVSDTLLSAPLSNVHLPLDPIFEPGANTFQSDQTIIHRYFRILANNMDHADLDIPEAYIIQNHIHEAAYEAKAAYEVTLQARDVSRKTNSVNDCYTAKHNQAQSSAGFEKIEAKELVDLIQRDGTTCSTKNEVPNSTTSVLTASMDDLHLATENDMRNVPLSSDDESDGSWSVVSGGSDYVVIDAAETARNISIDRSKKKPEVPPRPSSQARPQHSSVHQQGIVAGHNDRKEPVAESAIHGSRNDQSEHGKEHDRIKIKGEWSESSANRHATFARKMRRCMNLEAQVLQEACRQERDGEISR